MQLGIYLAGNKNHVVTAIHEVVEKEKERFKKECEEYQVHTGWDLSNSAKPLPVHQKVQIKDSYSEEILDLVEAHCIEQLQDLGDDEDCSVAFQITIHRRNVKV